jgi:hypothetical protein
MPQGVANMEYWDRILYLIHAIEGRDGGFLFASQYDELRFIKPVNKLSPTIPQGYPRIKNTQEVRKGRCAGRF